MDSLVRSKENSRRGDDPTGSAEMCTCLEAEGTGLLGWEGLTPAWHHLTQGCECLVRLKGKNAGESSGSLICHWCFNQMEPEGGCFWPRSQDW